MNIRSYPGDEYSESGDGPGSVNRFFKDLKKKSPALWVMTKETLKKAKKEKNLQFFVQNERVSRLAGFREKG